MGHSLRILPWKLTCPLKIKGWKMYSLLRLSLFRGHVSFRGCKWGINWGYNNPRRSVHLWSIHFRPWDIQAGAPLSSFQTAHLGHTIHGTNGMVYLPIHEWLIFLWFSCRYDLYQSHGCYGSGICSLLQSMHRLNLPDPATSGGSAAALRVLLRASLLQVPRRAGRKEESLKPSHLGQLPLGPHSWIEHQFLGWGPGCLSRKGVESLKKTWIWAVDLGSRLCYSPTKWAPRIVISWVSSPL